MILQHQRRMPPLNKTTLMSDEKSGPSRSCYSSECHIGLRDGPSYRLSGDSHHPTECKMEQRSANALRFMPLAPASRAEG